MTDPALQHEAVQAQSPEFELASIPSVETDVFDENNIAQFNVGVLALPNIVEDPRGWQAARRLRANVYIDEKGYLPSHSRQADGGETDCDDWRSVQFGVYENVHRPGESRMVGTSRLIVKSEDEALLPVETLFPDAFEGQPAELGSVEASRYIARHEDKFSQRATSLALMRAMASFCVRGAKQPVYATVEDSLAGLFDKIRLPFDQIGEARMLPEYNSVNLPIRIDPVEVAGNVQAQAHTSDIMRGFFKDVSRHHGLGYFDQTFTNSNGR